MKSKRIKTIIIFFSILFIVTIKSNAQVFSGFSAFKELIEYEGQRYLMDNIYQITSSDFDRLVIDKTIVEIDADEGFMFVLTSYNFNGKSGVVITSFNSTNFQNTEHQFTNVHLTNKEFIELNSAFIELEKNNLDYDEHILRKFQDRLIIDVNRISEMTYFTLWVDNYSRHTFTTSKWKRAFKRYGKFKDKQE